MRHEAVATMRRGFGFALHPDGERALFLRNEGFEVPHSLDLILNWQEELNRIAPPNR
ncbi:MAG: hypothetical protein ACI84D_003436 [Thalassolituus oleivorans]|jgi:hypothetical protein